MKGAGRKISRTMCGYKKWLRKRTKQKVNQTQTERKKFEKSGGLAGQNSSRQIDGESKKDRMHRLIKTDGRETARERENCPDPQSRDRRRLYKRTQHHRCSRVKAPSPTLRAACILQSIGSSWLWSVCEDCRSPWRPSSGPPRAMSSVHQGLKQLLETENFIRGCSDNNNNNTHEKGSEAELMEKRILKKGSVHTKG